MEDGFKDALHNCISCCQMPLMFFPPLLRICTRHVAQYVGKKKEAGLVARSSQYVAWKLNKFNLKRAVTKGIRFPDLNGKWEMEKERFPHEQHVLGMHATRPDPLTCPSEFPFESLFPLHSQLPLESTRNALN